MGALDGLMFRRDDGAAVSRFDLPAYEDLLLLLAIARSGSGKGGDAALSSASGKGLVTTPEVKPAPPPSLDTLAGELMLAPSQQMPVHAGLSGNAGPTGDARAPEIVEPDDDPHAEDDNGLRLSLEPRDDGRRIVR